MVLGIIGTEEAPVVELADNAGDMAEGTIFNELFGEIVESLDC